MVRDYSVRAGTRPELKNTAIGNLADGSTVEGSIKWENISEDVYNTVGDYTVKGTLSFSGLEEQEDIAVTARLHVIADAVALRNISTVTAEGTAPVLPSTVSGVLADGTLAGNFNVSWDETDAEQFSTVGEIVKVNGTAVIIGDETLPVSCSVRVAEAVNTESTNVAPNVSGLTQDIDAAYQSDNLNSIINGVTDFADNTNERWTNWNNRRNSAAATLTFSWATAQLLSGCNLYYYYDSCAAEPESVEFQYSLNGSDYVTIGHTSELVQSAALGAEYSYTFDSVINPVSVRVILTQQNGTSGTNCVGIIEAEMMTYAGRVEYNSSAALSGILVDGTEVSGFDGNTLEYTAAGESVTAATEVNAGITVLPVYTDGVVRILTVSEDGSEAKTYEVTLKPEEPVELTAPEVTVSVTQGDDGKLVLTGKFEDYENSQNYYTVTEHGLLYMTKARLGAKSMTVNTAGRTKVSFKSYQDDGSYSYSMEPRTSDIKYVVRAYLAYTNDAGKKVYVYSSPKLVSYDSLAK